MDYFDSKTQNIIDMGYDFGTGVWPILNENIEMKLTDTGIYKPVLNNKLHNKESNFDKLKEFNNFLENGTIIDQLSKEKFSNIPNINYDKRLGYYSSLYVGYVKELDYRENASSGGFGTWILKELLEQGHVDGVIHVKESNSNEKLFEYQISRTIEEVREGAKTKYYPVELSEVLSVVKQNEGNYAVVGVPSFIRDIYLLSKIEPIIKERIKFTIGLVCGHQKSSKFAEYLAWQCGITPGNLESVNFRKKLSNSSADDYGIEFKGKVKGKTKTIVKKMSELDGKDWGQGYFKVRASDFTDDVMNELADVTLGDAWLPEYTRDSKGNNIIITRDVVIDDIIKKALEKKLVNLDIVDKETMFKSQSAHYRHTHDELSYRLYKKEQENCWYPKQRVEPNNEIALTRKKIQDMREQICLQSHEHYKMAVQKNDISYFKNNMEPLVERYKKLYRIESYKKLGIRGFFIKVKNKVVSLIRE